MKWNHIYDGISFTVSDNAITYGREGDDWESVTLYDGMGVAIMDGVESAYQRGRAEALDAAEAAVKEAVSQYAVYRTSQVVAAIRALKEVDTPKPQPIVLINEDIK